MTIAYLNDAWVPLEEARISPLDRGFLYGDGIYEVIPVHHGKPVALNGHFQRLEQGLAAIGIQHDYSAEKWRALISELVSKNTAVLESDFLGVYLHVSRGADTKRAHAFPQNVKPTVFAFAFVIPPPPPKQRQQVNMIKVALVEDLRWKRCHIKSTSLLGNVLHFQQGVDAGVTETILYNANREVTEASACNVFVVSNGKVVTPPLDHQILPGITRMSVLKGVRQHTSLVVEERPITLSELYQAEEVWLTSSTKEIAPVSHVGGTLVGKGTAGPVWEQAINALEKVKFDG